MIDKDTIKASLLAVAICLGLAVQGSSDAADSGGTGAARVCAQEA